jgi:molybdopterin converting factor subunit 1
MIIRVRYFAYFKEKIRKNFELIELNQPFSVEELRKKISEAHNIDEEKILVAVNGAFADLTRVLRSDDEVAIFPPVSGG